MLQNLQRVIRDDVAHGYSDVDHALKNLYSHFTTHFIIFIFNSYFN